MDKELVRTYKPIKDIPGYLITTDGKVWSCKSKMWMKPSLTYKGYQAVNFYDRGKTKTRTIHRLVLEAFAGLRPKGYEACHIDGNKENNHIYNLRWDTSRSNDLDKLRHGRHNFQKLKETDILEIRRLRKYGWSQKQLASTYKVTQSNISQILNKKRWSHV